MKKMNYYRFLLLFSLVTFFYSCKKESANISSSPVTETSTDVIFIYNEKEVTYKKITKTYSLDHNGEEMDRPITLTWLDRNLGAERKAIVKNDSLARGDLFQWGRLADGHQSVTSDTIGQISTKTEPGHNKFISNQLLTGGGDWLVSGVDDLWKNSTSPNCPCPQGWRLPTSKEFLMELYSWSSVDMDSAFDSGLKWCTTGNRDNSGTYRYYNDWAFVWSSTPSPKEWEDDKSEKLWIVHDTAKVISSYRIYAGSVRCVK